MKTKKQLLVTLILLISGFFSAFAQKSGELLTFEQAMQIMHEQNPSIQRVKQQIRQKEFEVKAKKGLHLPQIGVSANAISMSDMLHLDLSPVGEAISPLYTTLGNYGKFSGVPNPDPATNKLMPVLPDDVSTAAVRKKLIEAGDKVAAAEWDQVIQEKNFATVSADFMWPLYTGGKIKSANQAANVELNISKEELRETKGEMLTELVTRYYGLALAVQVVEVRKQMVDVMQNHFSDAQKLYKNGMIAKVELLHASVALNEANREFSQAKRNIEIVRSGLNATLLLDSTKTIFPASRLFINNKLPNVSYWINKARKENPLLRQIESKRELVNIKNKVDKGSYLPTVAMMGTYNVLDKNLSPYAPDWVVGAGLKWTLFNGMTRKNNVKAGATLKDQVNYAEQKANADIEAYMIKLYQELQMQIEQKEELEGTLELANEYYDSTEKAFREGLATSTSVVEAYTKISQVKALKLKVLYDYDVALARFVQIAGVPEEYINLCNGENTLYENLHE